MISVILHLIQVVIAAIAGAGVFHSYKRGGSVNQQLKDFSKFFFLFSIYQLFLTTLLFTKNLTLVGWSYNVAIMLFFIMLTFALKIPLSILNFSPQKIKTLVMILMTIGIFVVIIQIFDFRLPIIDSSGFIFWNANQFAAWAVSLSGFIVAMIWVYVFLKNLIKYFSHREHFGSIEKTKNILLVFAAIMFGLSSLTYFHSHYLLTSIAFGAIFLGFFLILIILLFFSNKRYEREK